MGVAANHPLRKLRTLLVWSVLLASAWALWTWRLDASDLTFDEAATYFITHRPILAILSYLRVAVREHPPVYYLLIHVWMRLVGHSEFGLRLFSVGAGLVGLALTGWLARLALDHFRRVGSFLAVAVLIATPGMAFFARDARMYSLGLVWTILSAGLFVRDWLSTQDWPRRSAWIPLIAVNLLALFTHYYLILPILVQPLVLLCARRWRPLGAWGALHGLPALAGGLWLVAAPGLRMTVMSLSPHILANLPTAPEVERLLAKLLFSPVARVRYQLFEGLLLLMGLGLALAVWRNGWAGGWLALALVVPTALTLAMPHPPAPRYLVFLLPPAAVALSYVGTIPLRLPGIGLRWPALVLSLGITAAIAWGVATGGLSQSLTFEQSRYGRTLDTIKAYARPGDCVLFYGPWQWIQYGYYDPGGMPEIVTLPPAAPPRLDPDEARPVLLSLLTQYERVWLLPAAVDDVDPPHFVEGWLNRHAHRVWATRNFSLYTRPLTGHRAEHGAGLTVGENLFLERVTYDPLPIPAGEPLRMTLFWQVLRPLGRDLQLTFSLVDQEGHIWNIARSIPLEWSAPPSEWEAGQKIVDREGLMVPQGAPRGTYTLRVMVGDAATGEPLEVDGEKDAQLLNVEVAEPVSAPVLHDLPNVGTATFCAPEGTACAELVGYEPGGLRFQQGHAVPFTLHFLVSQGVELGEIRVRMVHRPNLPWLDSVGVATRTISLTSTPGQGHDAKLDVSPLENQHRLVLPVVLQETVPRQVQRLLTVATALAIPPDAPTGRAKIELEVLGPDGEAWLTAGGDTAVPLFDIAVEGRPVLRRVPKDVVPIEVDFGDEIGLRGYRIAGDPRPGGYVEVTYVWYARTHPTAVYAVFNHLVTADAEPVVQADGWPQGGRMLTIQWQQGEYIEDTHVVQIPPDAASGPYVLFVGLYNAANNDRQPALLEGERLPDDRMPLDVVEGAAP